jgi:hypothetical protein
MRYKLNKPSVNQPLFTFEHMFSEHGQLTLRGAFFEKYYEIHHYDPETDGEIDFHNWKTDLEKEPIIYHVQVSEIDYDQKTIFYIQFLQAYVRNAFNEFKSLFVERLDSCNNLQDQYFVLYTLKRKLNKFKHFLETSPLIPERKTQLKWLENMELQTTKLYENRTAFVSFSDQKLKPKDVERIVGKLISDLHLSKDPTDLNKIVYFICSKNMNEDFGYVNFDCPIWMLKEIIIKFQSFGFLKFKNVDIIRTEFFRRNGVPLKIDVWNNSDCSSEKNRLEGIIKLEDSFSLTNKV